MLDKSCVKGGVPAYLSFLNGGIPALYLTSSHLSPFTSNPKDSQKENEEAYDAVLASGIKCEVHTATDVDRPLLTINFQRFVGLKRIKEFLNSPQATKNIK